MNGVETCWRVRLCAWGAILIGCAVAHAATVYEPAPFEHYQPILDRMPFGVPPASAGALLTPEELAQQKSDEQLLAEQQQVARQISFTALNITPRGQTAVGFIDRSVNPPESYYLEVGASANGWTVVGADYGENWAQFEKDGVTITMHLYKGLIEGPQMNGTDLASLPTVIPSDDVPVAAKPQDELPVAAERLPVPGLVRLPASAQTAPSAVSVSAAAGPDSAPAPAKSYLERLRERRAQQTAEQQATEKARLDSLRELAQKAAQAEIARQRKQEQAEALEQLRLQQAEEAFRAAQAAELEAQAQAQDQPGNMQEQHQEAEPVPEEAELEEP